MENKTFVPSSVISLAAAIDYSDDGIVSKRVVHKDKGNVTLFAFDKGQRLSEHTAPFDALLQVVEGRTEVTINGKSHDLKTGEIIIMSAHIPHAVYAVEKCKILLTMIKSN
mgnify:CR=1 FL=1